MRIVPASATRRKLMWVGSKRSVSYLNAKEAKMVHHLVTSGSDTIPTGTLLYQMFKGGDFYYHETHGVVGGEDMRGVDCDYATILAPIYKGKDIEVTCGHCGAYSFVIREGSGTYSKYDTHSKSNKLNTADTVAMNKAKLKRKTYLIKKGYFKSRHLAERGISKITTCSLLRKWEDVKDKVTYPLLASYKLDGIRCTVYGNNTLMSRGGKEIVAPHLLEEIPNTAEFDGELVIPGESLEIINGVVSKENHKRKCELKYFIFDIPIPFQFYHRLERLEVYRDLFKDNKHVFVLPHVVIKNKQEADIFYQEALDMGHEGVVYRTLGGVYKGARTPEIIKRRPTISREFPIIDLDRDKDGLVIFILETDDKQRFRAVPSWTDEERSKGFTSTVGKQGEVEYMEMTTKGVPRHPVFKVVREIGKDKELVY